VNPRDHARRPFPALRGRRQPGGDWRAKPPADTLPERLIAAREAKGVDLLRAERETKIRRAYLAALEAGDYAQLPGTVYARGFIRNYATYLGIDPDEALAMYTRERGTYGPTDPVLVVPRGVQAPRRALVIPPGLVAVVLVGLAAVLILVYIAFQLVRFNEPPPITVTDPAQGAVTLAEKTTTYTLRGTSSPGAEVTIEATGRGSVVVIAGGDGTWQKAVDLRGGRNLFVVTARDPKTQAASKDPVQLVLNVPLSTAVAPTLTLDSPAAGASFENGAVPISGTTGNATAVSISAKMVAAAASPGASPKPATGTRNTTAKVKDDGTFSASLDLTAGTWSISVTAKSDAGQTTTVTRTIDVVYKGVTLVIEIKGGRAWLKAWVDGELSTDTNGAGGRTLNDGDTLTLRAAQSIEVRTGAPGVTYYTLNGKHLGTLGTAGKAATWLFQPPGAPKQTN
jgi:cytoskeletal protein RodZ